MTSITTVVTTFYGWSCDKRNCPNEFRLDHDHYSEWSTEARDLARLAGWSFWRSRSNYVFCSDHGPSKSAKRMQEMTR